MRWPWGRLRDRPGWLEEFRAALGEWSASIAVIEATLEFVRCRGLTATAGRELEAAVPAAAGCGGELRRQLIAFVTEEASKVRPGGRLPGTTEVLESCFGKLKALEDGQSKGGFTGLVLSLGAMVSTWTARGVAEALERCRARDVLAWCRTMPGPSVQARRRQAYSLAEGATKPG